MEKRDPTEYDIYLFKEGSHARIYEFLGSKPHRNGVDFSVWAPEARGVSVVSDKNNWTPGVDPLYPRWDSSGIFEGSVDGMASGSIYKYAIETSSGRRLFKGDPLAFQWEEPPRTASSVASLSYTWGDQEWMESRFRANALDAPLAIYEVHPGSWRRIPEENDRMPGYRELAPLLAEYVSDMGFTHVEFLPLMEHPFYGSWGYQITGYFAPTARYGSPQDLMYLIDTLHQADIGVIVDWVPSHFPSDLHGLAVFDGSHCYEHADPSKGFHPEWQSCIFNYGRHEVRSFLLSSALFWLDYYHADGLRVDGVASMLYLDYARPSGDWTPNMYGGKENLEAIQFLRLLNETVYAAFPDVQVIAEESTAWPMVTRPTYTGGLGFGMKWNMGWMHDTLRYMKRDPVHRPYHHDELTFSIIYAFSENYLLPLSHDEVVYGKGSLLGKMPGDRWQQFANLRLLYGYMYTHPGRKLLFMGGEFAQEKEWDHDAGLDWHHLSDGMHGGVQRLVRDLNSLYRNEPALHQNDDGERGFSWIDHGDRDQSVITYLRRSPEGRLACTVCNFTPVPRYGYRIGVPVAGYWEEVINTDSAYYGGSNCGNNGALEACGQPWHGHPYCLSLTLPPLATLILRPRGDVS
ncbi:MAG: 1,4-alpha-glucan branching protein GlgB [Methanocalculus sp. MSAO_Arc1]|uniref:1,4-alpha-glucan branching protein GlgB n=1 Tax=Methanocalculus TaxID=71151 RepID=UPI000FF7CFEC|nr:MULTISPECIES: 1,4-alpha-glucan branching protein GlgB [unclassified Methanocalculus]MCP1662651.1 1,4-alpha-glucan branching enzyme [Methanocalculus sp. AMF5]RQD80318.1 MAG: 1,4-alpha-glucan branching protein GlgB [Methanocalculus sp. MSAO_Arc1]